MLERAAAIPVMSELEARFRVMDEFPGYVQVPSLAGPPVEALEDVALEIELAQIANDEQAEAVSRHPDRFMGFVACLPMSDPAAAQREASRAIHQLGARGVQISTNINGHSLDEPQFLEVIRHVARLHRPIWLHPTRGMDRADYRAEAISKFDLWWAFGWPHETSVAMGRLVFSGILEEEPRPNIITHHAGGTIPMMENRITSGLSLLGTRCPPGMEHAVESSLRSPPIDLFKRFHADTATFGSRAALECGLAFFGPDQMVFASDMPFDPEQGRGYIHSTLQALKEMNLTADDREKILAGNARRLCGLAASQGRSLTPLTSPL